MSGYILCQVKKAGKPYFIENVSVNIYTIEELCFYLCNNLYLIDHTIRNEELSRWLEEELGLRALAAKTRSHLKATDSLGEFLYPILKEINYLDYEELRALNNRLTQMAEESSEVRKKKRADCLVANGMYVDAIQSYQEILKNEERLPRCGRRGSSPHLQPEFITTWDVRSVICSRRKKQWSVSGKLTGKFIRRVRFVYISSPTATVKEWRLMRKEWKSWAWILPPPSGLRKRSAGRGESPRRNPFLCRIWM